MSRLWYLAIEGVFLLCMVPFLPLILLGWLGRRYLDTDFLGDC